MIKGFTGRVNARLGPCGGFLLCVLRDLRVLIEFFRVKFDVMASGKASGTNGVSNAAFPTSG